jgi:hypothetical protein
MPATTGWRRTDRRRAAGAVEQAADHLLETGTSEGQGFPGRRVAELARALPEIDQAPLAPDGTDEHLRHLVVVRRR